MKRGLLGLVFLFSILMTRVMADVRLASLKQLESFRKEAVHSFEKKGDVGEIESAWKVIAASANQENIPFKAAWGNMTIVISAVNARLNEITKDPSYTKKPKLNLMVPGLPVSGMAVEDVEDVKVREEYRKAIEENDKTVKKSNYLIKLKIVHGSMLTLATRILKGHVSDKEDFERMLRQITEP